MQNNKVSVIGGGSFGTVIANIIATNGFDVQFWMRSSEQVAQINNTRENPQYLPSYKLNSRVLGSIYSVLYF